MDDETRRRYLRQQVELGGAEVILRRDVPAARPREDPTPPSGGTEPKRVETPTDASMTEDPKWLAGAPPIPGPGLSVSPAPASLGEAVWADLDEIAAAVAGCHRCALAEGRMHTVPGEGSPTADFMLVGEGPGAREDETGRPFVGRAGELLSEILGAIGLRREEVFIANIVKCRPPQNRKPLPDEQAACLPYLHRQITLIRPKVLVALGGTAAEALLGVKESLGALRGRVHRYDGIPLVVTYHPAALLRNPHWKKPTWDDVRIARQLLDA